MKFLSDLFRPKSKPSAPTAYEGLQILEDACEKTLKRGLDGFVIATISKPGSQQADLVISFQGAIGNELSHAFKVLLTSGGLGTLVLHSMITALSETGAAKLVQMPECQCPACTARRADEKASQTPTINYPPSSRAAP